MTCQYSGGRKKEAADGISKAVKDSNRYEKYLRKRIALRNLLDLEGWGSVRKGKPSRAIEFWLGQQGRC